MPPCHHLLPSSQPSVFVRALIQKSSCFKESPATSSVISSRMDLRISDITPPTTMGNTYSVSNTGVNRYMSNFSLIPCNMRNLACSNIYGTATLTNCYTLNTSNSIHNIKQYILASPPPSKSPRGLTGGHKAVSMSICAHARDGSTSNSEQGSQSLVWLTQEDLQENQLYMTASDLNVYSDENDTNKIQTRDCLVQERRASDNLAQERGASDNLAQERRDSDKLAQDGQANDKLKLNM